MNNEIMEKMVEYIIFVDSKMVDKSGSQRFMAMTMVYFLMVFTLPFWLTNMIIPIKGKAK